MTDRHNNPKRTLRATVAEFSAQDLAAQAIGSTWNQFARDALMLYVDVAQGKHPALKPAKSVTL